MIRRLCRLLVLLPSALAAEPVTIRSGEHDTFVRLVLSIPARAEWELGRSGAGYLLGFPGSELSIETDGVFARIPRTRLRSLVDQGGNLFLDLACDCHVTAYLWREDRLVVDINDGPPPPGSRFETPFPTVAPSADLAENREPAVPTSPAPSPATPAPARSEPPDYRPESGAGFPSIFDQSSGGRPQWQYRGLDQALEAAPRVAALEQELLESLSRATSQGLLSPATDGSELQTMTRQPEADSPDRVGEPPVNLTIERPTAEASGPGVRTSTSIERALTSASGPAVRRDGTECLDATYFEVSSWADERPFHLQLADRRAGLTTEADRPDPDALVALARFYVHHGFGREALAALSRADTSDLETLVLASMAHVVDDRMPSHPILADQADCPSAAGLWSILASTDPEAVGFADPGSVLQALRGLPDPIRGHLGQRLAARFAEGGDPDTAEAILTISEFGATAEAFAVQAVEAAIAEQKGDTDLAIHRLSGLAESEPRLTPESLVRLLDLTADAGHVVPEDILALAEILRFEHASDRVLVADLLRAEVIGWLTRKEFDRSLALLEMPGGIAEEERPQLISRVYRDLTDGATDDAFLAMAFDDVPAVTAETENRMAARLLALGFAERAEMLLRAEARQEAARDRRLLKARLALALGRFEDVERSLAGMSDPESNRILAEAAARNGDVERAMLLARGGSDPSYALMALRAESWPNLVGQEDTLLAELADLRLGRDIADEAVMPPLAWRRELLSDSASTRDLAKRIVDRFEIASGSGAAATN